jgi:hypothetical protein
MLEDQTLCGTKKGKVEPTPVSQDEVEKAERAQAVQVEIQKIQSLPDRYLAAEWRKHVGALDIRSLTLIYLMADRAKEHESDVRATQALDEVGKASLETEHSVFDRAELPGSCATIWCT